MFAVGVCDLAQQQCTPIAKPRCVPAELVTGVRLRDRRGINGEPVPGQQTDPVGTA
jgi:hypothetical protein